MPEAAPAQLTVAPAQAAPEVAAIAPIAQSQQPTEIPAQ